MLSTIRERSERQNQPWGIVVRMVAWRIIDNTIPWYTSRYVDERMLHEYPSIEATVRRELRERLDRDLRIGMVLEITSRHVRG